MNCELRVGLLGCTVQESYGGINYVINLTRALATLPEGDRPSLTLFVDPCAPNADDFNPIRSLIEQLIPLAGPAVGQRGIVRRVTGIASRLIGLWAAEVRRAARRAGCDVLFPTSLALGQPTRPVWIGWAYDLQHLHLPELFPRTYVWRRDFYFAQLARQAPKIVVSSQAARVDWLSRFPKTGARVSVLSFTSVPVDEWYSASPDAVLAKHHLPRKFLLLPNQFWMHKNHSTAFEAIRLLRDRGLDVPLACTGATHDVRRPEHFGILRDWIARHRLGEQIRLLGLLPAAEQIQLARAAAAVVQPSLFEGWSTVVEEGRALGKVMFLSDIPVHREQSPPGARFFPPRVAVALADLIAAEWDFLEPGPHGKSETAARQTHASRVTHYARAFMQIASEASAAHGVRP